MVAQIIQVYAKFFEFIQPHLDKVPLLFNVKGSIVVMFLIVYTSKYLEILLSFLLLQFYDNVQHGGSKKTSGKGTWQERLVHRAFCAHNNQWEAFIGFTAAVFMALQTVNDQKELTVLVNAFILVRLVYNVVYILAFNAPLSAIRSGVWAVGLTIIMRIFALAVADVNYKA